MPFAPHLAEEIWEHVRMQREFSYAPYPKAEEKYLQDDVVTYVVQVNGKVRGKFDLPKDETQEVILTAAKKNPLIAKYLDGQTVQKVVFVPNKLLNIVL